MLKKVIALDIDGVFTSTTSVMLYDGCGLATTFAPECVAAFNAMVRIAGVSDILLSSSRRKEFDSVDEMNQMLHYQGVRGNVIGFTAEETWNIKNNTLDLGEYAASDSATDGFSRPYEIGKWCMANNVDEVWIIDDDISFSNLLLMNHVFPSIREKLLIKPSWYGGGLNIHHIYSHFCSVLWSSGYTARKDWNMLQRVYQEELTEVRQHHDRFKFIIVDMVSCPADDSSVTSAKKSWFTRLIDRIKKLFGVRK